MKPLATARAGVLGRAPEAASLLRQNGPRHVARRIVRRIYQRTGAGELDFPLLPEDVADSTRIRLTEPTTGCRPGSSLTVGWIITPPSPGSGGHTTLFRMVEALERAGHICHLYLYDRYGGDVTRHAQVIRAGWPQVKADVRDVKEGISCVDACFATSWDTAHVLATRQHLSTRRFYFVQDFEPFFYPRGSTYSMAEDTYRFGFRMVAIGHMVADLLRTEIGVKAEVAEFGIDGQVYRLTNPGRRSGVVFYTKPDVPRRGFYLGSAALEEFHRRHPEQEIHVFGGRVMDLRFPATRHATMTPQGLSELYNSAIAGFSMSFTNISLVAGEMLAAGTIPVVNDSPYARADLSNSYVAWSRATPGAMADVLSELVEADGPAVAVRAASAAASVQRDNWAPAMKTLVEAVERASYA